MTEYESPLEHSSSPDGCREDCPACEDERLVRDNERLVAVNAQLLAACKAVRDGWEKNLTEPMRLINAAIDAAEGKP